MRLRHLSFLALPVLAHIAPSPTENNRYAKLVLLADGARVAYTIYFGERPGAMERRRMDTNGDGTLDDGEAKAFGARLVAEVGPNIDVELDGHPVPAAWTIADVGLGSPTASGGSFSVDLALQVTFPDGSGPGHALWLEDRWPIPDPGETEVRIEAAPGVKVTESHVKRDGAGILLHYLFRGAPQAAGDRAILVRFEVPAATAAPPRSEPPPHRFRALWVAGGLVVLALAGIWVYRKMKG